MQIGSGNFFADLLGLIIGLSFAFAFGMKYERDQWKAGKRRKEMERLLRTWKEIDI